MTAPVLRQVTDLDALMRWRAEVIAEVFGTEPDAALLENNRRYYASHVAAGSHMAFEALAGRNEPCGCGAVCFSDELPSPDNPSGRCAYLMNIYVRPAWRSRGVAHAIVRRLVDEARRRGCGKIYLETTAAARPVYTSLGFADMPDMMKYDKQI